MSTTELDTNIKEITKENGKQSEQEIEKLDQKNEELKIDQLKVDQLKIDPKKEQQKNGEQKDEKQNEVESTTKEIKINIETLDRMPNTGHLVEVNDKILHYEKKGDGKIVVLLMPVSNFGKQIN